MNNADTLSYQDEIAVIGMTCRLPGAENLDQFWQNLREGVESVSFFSEQELMASGVDSAMLNDPAYVRASAVLEDIELFDASFFGYTPREAEIMDPQHRVFLECAWEALEHAGYDSERYEKRIGVYAGVSMNTYALSNLYTNHDIIETVSPFQIALGNEKDHLASRISYKLHLRGPAICVSTACSTSLVTIHLACQSLLNGESDMCLAGGVSIRVPHKVGYAYQEGGIASPDGHCRAFDAKARGTVLGNGVGIVVLKRLADALQDGDCIHAVIKGSAINNDGSVKVGYTAPGVQGQAEVISEAQAIASVEPETITYIETHGTGTPLGDPIEIAALTKVFRARTEKQGFCSLGSVKTNFGHLDAAAGVTGFIKTVLALKHRLLPPSLHFEQPNPEIDFVNSPFYVNTSLSPWEPSNTFRRAGVSSFGIGGTNAHVILEEAPRMKHCEKSRPWQLLVLSAKTNSALNAVSTNLAQYLRQHPELNLADVAFTLQVGRRHFGYRRSFVCRDLTDAIEALDVENNSVQEIHKLSIVFLFSGQGTQYVNMALELYRTEPVFRKQIDLCCELLKPCLKLDLRTILYPSEEKVEEAAHQLKQTFLAQPALFVIEYAFARLWMEWGARPTAMIGHSVGEYVAACLSGVFSLADALALVAVRGRLMQQLPGGAMVTISLSEKDVQAYLSSNLSLAAINGATDCVISGPTDAIETLEQQLTEKGVSYHRLHTSHAFHSTMMDSCLKRFISEVNKVPLNPPKIPYISNVTGTWITEMQATDPGYWARHLRRTVRFADGLQVLLHASAALLLEVGPGRTLTTFARRHPASSTDHILLSSLRHPQDQDSDVAFLLKTCGRLWSAGLPISWSKFSSNEQRQRVPLPAYPFERERYWISPGKRVDQNSSPPLLSKKPDIADWFSIPSWKRSTVSISNIPEGQDSYKPCWLVFADGVGLGNHMIQRLEEKSEVVVKVVAGERFSRVSDRVYTLCPRRSDDYDVLIKELYMQGIFPTLIAHLWTVIALDQVQTELEFLETAQLLGFYSLLFLMQALGKQNIVQPLQIGVISNNLHEIIGGEMLCPARATILGPCRVIPYEYPNVTCRSVDVVIPESGIAPKQLVDKLIAELKAGFSDLVVAYRGTYRWIQTIEPVRLEERADEENIQLRQRGVYLITGGLGGIGIVLAEHLARSVQARLVLMGRSVPPPKAAWRQWLITHDHQNETSRKIRQIQALEDVGAEVLIIGADVTNIEEMQAVLAQIQERFGALHGVIHTAGIAGGGMIQLKKPEEAASVLAPKVEGTLILEEVCRNIHLDFIVLCSALSSILGGLGQVDYCAGNAFLDSFAFYNTSRHGTATVSINWDAWQEVGMAVNAATPHKAQRTYATAGVETLVIDHPILERYIMEDSGEAVYIAELSVARHWVLNEHRILGSAVVSGTTFLEMVRAAFEIQTKRSTMEIRDVVFLVPLVVEENEIREVRLALKKEEDNYSFLVTSRAISIDDEKGQWLSHVEGKVGPLYRQMPEQYENASLKRQKDITTLLEDTVKNEAERMQFGPRWDVLKEANFLGDEGLAVLELAEDFLSDQEKLLLHPALLDVATGFVARHRVTTPGVSYLPFSYKRLSISRPLPRRCMSYARSRLAGLPEKEAPEALLYDIVITDEQGRYLVEIEDFCLRRVDAPTTHAQTSTYKQTTPIGKHQFPLSKGEKRHSPIAGELIHLKDGILSHEGQEVFRRILSRATIPQIVVSTRDIQALRRQVVSSLRVPDMEIAEPLETGSAHNRPDMETSYITPGSELERQIANIWQRTLGINEIGIHDNFFELGGDSVMIIQIIKLLHDAFQVTLSMNLIFEAPTVAGLAEVIMQKQMELIDQEQMNELLGILGQMSEEDVMLQLGKDLIEQEIDK